ncbi:hypothetical protein HZA26_02170 [Candidatus Nomurabacteria bacterium]|nr:hypothetical protein [Candidatus Nomurabacteria bacterium]
MDIFAHTLWANAMAREANDLALKKNQSTQVDKKFQMHVGWTAFFGVFPDFFAFTIPFLLRFYFIIVGGNSLSTFFERPRIEGEGFQNGFDLAHNLYQYSHSLVIWGFVFIVVWAIYKRPRYELLGWALHILIDIPSHVLAFFPTPFLFPISDYKFPYGIQWSNQWFAIINYSLLLLVFGRFLWRDFWVGKSNKI